MRIFLTGMPASGKSFWGRKIAAYLNLPFFDLDNCIEEKFVMKIADIFETHCEVFFRKKEKEILQEIIFENENFVMATGGGTVCFFHNIEMMKNAGVLIYLKSDVSELINRLNEKEKSKRPLLQKVACDKLNEYLHNILNERQPYYQQSDMIIDTNETGVEMLIEQIKKLA